MNLLSNNSKTIKSVNMSIGKTCSRQCPFFDAGCYGQKGRFNFSNVTQSNEKRWELYAYDPQAYFAQLRIEIVKSGLSHIRIFGIGDFPNKKYAIKLIELMASLPDTKFWIASFKAGLKGWQDMEHAINALPNVVCRVSYNKSTGRDKHEYTSSAVTDNAICPCVKGSDMNCATCGHLCWKKSVKFVSYKKH